MALQTQSTNLPAWLTVTEAPHREQANTCSRHSRRSRPAAECNRKGVAPEQVLFPREEMKCGSVPQMKLMLDEVQPNAFARLHQIDQSHASEQSRQGHGGVAFLEESLCMLAACEAGHGTLRNVPPSFAQLFIILLLQ